MRLLSAFVLAMFLVTGCGEDSVVERPEEDGDEAVLREPVLDEPDPAPGRVISTSTDSEAEEDAEPGEERAPAAPPATVDSKPAAPAESPRPQSPSSGSGSGSSSSPTTPQTSISGRYTLHTVDGKALPVVTDSRPGCQIEVVSGHLTINDGSRFTFSTETREICDGEITTEDVWEAKGTIARSGSSLRFEGASGENFGTADGVLISGGLRIEAFATEAGTEAVDWKFAK